jgi:hypothetical protein
MVDLLKKNSAFLESSRFFLHIEAKLLHRRPIVDGKQNRVIGASVFVVVPFPRRHRENVPLMIFQALAFDDNGALAFESKIEGRAVMPVR